MRKHNLTTALRTLKRQPGYTFINVSGLGLGLACCFLIVLYVQHERSYDRFHAHADRTYLLAYASQQNGVEQHNVLFPASTGPRLQDAFPGVEQVIRFWNSGLIARVENEPHRIDAFYPVDSGFFEAFSFPLVQGNPETVLQAPNSAVLTESQAGALFGSENPLGKTLTVVSFATPVALTVTGVMEDPPTNTWFSGMHGVYTFDALAAQFGRDVILEGHGGPSNFNVFVLLKPGTDPATFSATSGAFVKQEFQPGMQDQARLTLLPITELHLSAAGRRTLYVFSAVAALILLIACVNFTNLTTARAAKRAREVGVRKTLGAHRRQLVVQFLGESMLLSVLSIVLAMLLLPLLWPVFTGLIGQDVRVEFAQQGGVVGVLLGIGLLAGVVAGSYPAFYLSAFRPARVLKGEVEGGRAAAHLRQGLTVFQFAVSVFLIIGTLTIYRQVRYMKSRPLGFEKEQVVLATTSPTIRDRLDAFKQQLLQHPRIVGVTATNSVPGRFGSTRTYSLAGEPEASWTFRTLFADPQYLDVLGIQLKAGRFFSEEMSSDQTRAALLNKAAVNQLGVHDPLGKTIQQGDQTLEVIGILEDFHFQGLTQEIGPLVVQMDPTQAWYVAARIAPQHVGETLAYMKEQWAAFDPNWAFSLNFLDELFDRQYRTQEHQGRLFTVFAALALFIACMGLFGLAAFVTERRTKEIGIRKVLGATVPGLVVLLSKDFLKLVVAAFVVAFPVAYVVMEQWLSNFAYRVALGPGVFVVAGMVALVIAQATVGYLAVKAGLVNPVNVLRYD